MKRNRTLLWCAVPALALYALLSLYPLFKAARMSLTDFSGVGDAHWIGLANYVAAFRDPASLHTLAVTFAYAAIVVIVQNGLGLLFAALLFSLPRLRGALRVGLLVPSMFSAVIAGFVWEYLYSPLGGGINELLHLVVGNLLTKRRQAVRAAFDDRCVNVFRVLTVDPFFVHQRWSNTAAAVEVTTAAVVLRKQSLAFVGIEGALV